MKYLILFIILFFPLVSISQEVEDKKSRFPLFELNKGNDDAKNINWGNFHFNNESYRKAASRYEKVENPSVEIQRNLGKSYVELDSVEKASELAKLGKIKLFTEAEVKRLYGDDHLEAVVIKHNDSEKGETYVEVDNFIPLFGLSPKLGPIGDWGLEIERNAIKVNNAKDYQTNIPGVFAIGDVNTYEGKLKLILSGFHEAAVMCQYAYQIINPGKRFVMKYTTVGGVEGFDGSKKVAKKEVVQSIS